MAGKLTALEVKALTNPGRYTDGDGLHLNVRAADKRAWVLRYTLHGRTRDMGLGAFPEVSLAEARKRAADARRLMSRGEDPVAARQRATAEAVAAAAEDRTFRAAAKAVIEGKRPGWRNPKHAAQWAATLERYAYPVFGDWPVRDVDTDAVLRVLRDVWTRAPETASRLRGRIEAVLDAARARGWRTGENPARWRGHLAELLPPPRKVAAVEHHPALPWRDLPRFLAELRDRKGTAARALEFAILTAARSGEVRGMTWREVDLAECVWTIPGKRMKGGKTHRVPLSEHAMALLGEMMPRSGRREPDGLVFPGAKRASPLSDMALSMLVRGMCFDGLEEGEPPRWRDEEGRAIVPHGFRSSFKDWTRTQGFADHLSERALAHTDRDKVRAAYARDDLLADRRRLMDQWAEWCRRPPGRVVPLPTAAKAHG